MPIHDELRDVLRAHPHLIPVLYIELEDYVDSGGEDALRICVVLDEQAEDLSGSAVVRFKAAIRECLLQQGIAKFPYVFLTKASERASVEARDGIIRQEDCV